MRRRVHWHYASQWKGRCIYGTAKQKGLRLGDDTKDKGVKDLDP